MPVTVMLMIAITAAFALQQIDDAYINSGAQGYLALSAKGLKHGFVWQIFTFQFLHIGLWHLLCNLIVLWFFGRFIEQRLGKWQFVKIYFLSGLMGGALHTLLAWSFPQHFGFPVVGASAGVCGLLAAAIILEPENNILLFCVLPIRAKYLLVASVAIAFFFTVVPSDRSVAHAAHLGGLLTGAAYIWWGLYAKGPAWSRRPFRSSDGPRELARAGKFSGWARKRRQAADELPAADFISREVDPILDKISAHGIQSLTPHERKILEAARAKMERR